MKGKILIAAVFGAVMIGCSSSETVTGGGGGGIVNQELKAVYGPESCHGAPVSDIRGRWLFSQVGEGISLNMIFDVSNSYLTLTNYCEMGGRTLSAQVSSSISIYGNTLKIWNSDQDQTVVDEPGFRGNCNVSVEASETNYSFQGDCLVLQRPGFDKLYLKQINN